MNRVAYLLSYPRRFLCGRDYSVRPLPAACSTNYRVWRAISKELLKASKLIDKQPATKLLFARPSSCENILESNNVELTKLDAEHLNKNSDIAVMELHDATRDVSGQHHAGVIRPVIVAKERLLALFPKSEQRNSHDFSTLYERMCSHYLLGGRLFYIPNTGSVNKVVREYLRQGISSQPVTDGLDFAFYSLRRLNQTLSTASSVGLLQLNPNSKMHDIKTEGISLSSNIRPGVVLVSHPLVSSIGESSHRGVMYRSLVLVTKHSKNKPSSGLVINKSRVENEKYRCGGVVHSRKETHDISTLRLVNGGTTTSHTDIQLCIEDFRNLNGTPMIIEISCSSERRLISDSQMPNEFSFKGRCEWVEGQLQKEIDEGLWIPIEMSAPVLQQLLRSTDSSLDDAWSNALQCLPGEYRSLAMIPTAVDLFSKLEENMGWCIKE